MSFDHEALGRAVAAHGAVVRVVVAKVRGSAPREVGAAMLVWDGGQSGTIGGGRLEFEAAARARDMTAAREVMTAALGPDMGQCCGGAVTLLLERFEAEALPGPGPVARPLEGGADLAPISVTRKLRDWRGGGSAEPVLLDGWFVEPPAAPRSELWLYGAGHVGRALVSLMAPLPGWRITWVDTAPARFPEDVPEGVTCLPAPDPARAVARAPRDAHHLVMTYSHEMDLALCHAILSHAFASAGLIGSATKWARFRKRLAALGHGDAQISRIACPIGDPSLGKHPQAIALGVAAALLKGETRGVHAVPKTGESRA